MDADAIESVLDQLRKTEFGERTKLVESLAMVGIRISVVNSVQRVLRIMLDGRPYSIWYTDDEDMFRITRPS